MKYALTLLCVVSLLFGTSCAATAAPAFQPTDHDWEITPESEAALEAGLNWLARNQGPDGNWDSNDLGLVSMGALAFLAAGHEPGRGRYGQNVERALNYVLRNATNSGLLNIADPQRDMYNHGLSTFVLGQAYGMTNDTRVGPVLDRALKLIANTQCKDGGWDYRAAPQDSGHDLSLAVMQAKALRSAVDSGLEVPPEVITLAIKGVRKYYTPKNGDRSSEAAQKSQPGQFTYTASGQASLAMAAAGVVCLQEFGQYDDWRIGKSMEFVSAQVKSMKTPTEHNGQFPEGFEAYTVYYVGQACYQVGGPQWKENYTKLRDALIAGQMRGNPDRTLNGHWSDRRVGGKPGDLYGTAVACFVLAIPNRYLPILQEGKIESLKTHMKSD